MNRQEALKAIHKAHWNFNNPMDREQDVINDIFDDFESHTCGNCSLVNKRIHDTTKEVFMQCFNANCSFHGDEVESTDGCNKFVRSI